MEKIKVHVADDHKILIDGVIALLNTEDDIEVVGYSLTGSEVVNWFASDKADVLVLDINMPELDGIEVLKAFQKRKITQKTVVLSSLSDVKLVHEVIGLGANGFIEKSSASEHIIKAIRTVYKNEKYYSDEIKNNLLNLYVSNSKTENFIKNTIEEPLTERETEILKLITQEYSTSEIAEKLSLGNKTIESHRRSLYKKLRVKNVVGLAMYAVKNNIV